MPRRRYRLRSRACERTTSVSWRSPTAPQPSSRSSQSGSLTPSTWTDAHSSTAALLGESDHYSNGPGLACSVLHLQQNYLYKLTTWSAALGLSQISANTDLHVILRSLVDLWYKHHYRRFGTERGDRRSSGARRHVSFDQHALPSFEFHGYDASCPD